MCKRGDSDAQTLNINNQTNPDKNVVSQMCFKPTGEKEKIRRKKKKEKKKRNNARARTCYLYKRSEQSVDDSGDPLRQKRAFHEG